MELFHIKARLLDEYVLADDPTEVFKIASRYLGGFVITNVIGDYNIHPIDVEKFKTYCKQVKLSQIDRHIKGEITYDQLCSLLGVKSLTVEDQIILEELNNNYLLCLLDF